MSVKKWRQRHACQRAFERYGVFIGNAKLAKMVEKIVSGKSIPVPDANKSLAIRCHVVQIEDLPEMAVLYDKNRKIIVTVLPDDSAEMQHYRAGQP